MDIESRQAMWQMIKNIRTQFGTTIFLTTHYLEEADMLSDTICIMKAGHELAQDTPKNLRAWTKCRLIKLVLADAESARKTADNITRLPFVISAEYNKETIYIRTENETENLKAVVCFVMEQNVSFESVGIVQSDLDTVFMELTRSSK